MGAKKENQGPKIQTQKPKTQALQGAGKAMTTLERIKDYTERLMKLGLPEREARAWAAELVWKSSRDGK